MVHISFTPNLARLVEAPASEVDGATLGGVLEAYFRDHPRVRGYVLDDQGAVRKHVAVFVNRDLIRDRRDLTHPVREGDRIFIAQALSGG